MSLEFHFHLLSGNVITIIITNVNIEDLKTKIIKIYLSHLLYKNNFNNNIAEYTEDWNSKYDSEDRVDSTNFPEITR